MFLMTSSSKETELYPTTIVSGTMKRSRTLAISSASGIPLLLASCGVMPVMRHDSGEGR